jgi:hypothetical protein
MLTWAQSAIEALVAEEGLSEEDIDTVDCIKNKCPV